MPVSRAPCRIRTGPPLVPLHFQRARGRVSGMSLPAGAGYSPPAAPPACIRWANRPHLAGARYSCSCPESTSPIEARVGLVLLGGFGPLGASRLPACTRAPASRCYLRSVGGFTPSCLQYYSASASLSTQAASSSLVIANQAADRRGPGHASIVLAYHHGVRRSNSPSGFGASLRATYERHVLGLMSSWAAMAATVRRSSTPQAYSASVASSSRSSEGDHGIDGSRWRTCNHPSHPPVPKSRSTVRRSPQPASRPGRQRPATSSARPPSARSPFSRSSSDCSACYRCLAVPCSPCSAGSGASSISSTHA